MRRRYRKLAAIFVHPAAAVLAIVTFSVMPCCRARSPLTPAQAEGKRLYEVGCAHCHEENDLHLKTVPPDLHGLFDKKALPGGEPATDTEVESLLMSGKGDMPSFAYQMSRDQMDDVVAYLHTGMRGN